MRSNDIKALVGAVEEHFTNEHTFAPIKDSDMFQAVAQVKYLLQTYQKTSSGSNDLLQAVTYLATLAKQLADDDSTIYFALSSLGMQ